MICAFLEDDENGEDDYMICAFWGCMFGGGGGGEACAFCGVRGEVGMREYEWVDATTHIRRMWLICLRPAANCQVAASLFIERVANGELDNAENRQQCFNSAERLFK